MTSQYDINLSNGTVLATLYPLEFNGPDNRSTPRQVLQVRPTFPITVAVDGTNTITIIGDETLIFRVGFQFQIVDSTGNNGTHTVQTVWYTGGNTLITTSTNIASSVPDGVAMAHVFVMSGDVSDRLIAGYQFDVSNSGQIDATYTVTALGSGKSGTEVTDISTVADTTSSLNNKYFMLYSPSTEYYVWYTDGTGDVDPAPGGTAIPVAYTTDDTADAIASLTQIAIAALPAFTAAVLANVVTVTGTDIGTAMDAVDGDTSFVIDTTTQGVAQETVIPVVHGTIRDNTNTPIALPYGSVDYINTDPNTVLKLPGRGVMNYGEMVVENMVRMTENFAADVAPELNATIGTTPVGDPLVGQQWYKTLAGEEGFLFYDGTIWSNYFDVDNGAMVFRDPQNAVVPNTDMFLTADESRLPVGYTGTDEAGLVLWTENNPNALDPIFRVMSTDGSERIRIEHDGWIRTSDNLEVIGGGNGSIESYFHGKLGIGSDGLPTITSTLTVEGDGIAVNSDAGLDASVILNSPTGKISQVVFDNQGARQAEIYIDHTISGMPLEINTVSSNDVVFVRGGGNVGIATAANPTASLQIKEHIYFGEGSGNETVGSDIRFAGSGLVTSDTNTYITYDATAGGISAFEVRSGSDNTTTSTIQMHIDNDKVYIDTDTLYVNTAADRVGVNMAPAYPFDVTGTSRFNSPVGINNVPPSGSPVWLEITGDLQVNSQIRGSDQTAASPTFSFTNALDTGMYNNAGVLTLAVDGVDVYSASSTLTTFAPDIQFDGRVGINGVPPTLDVWLTVVGDIQTTTKMLSAYGTAAAPAYTFTSDETTGMFATAASVDLTFGGVVGLTLDAARILTDRVVEGVTYTFAGDTSTAISTSAAGKMTISSVTDTTLRTAGIDRFTVEVDGTLSSNTASYESLVIAANDIPNKAYVDDRAIPTFEEVVATGGENIINTTLKTTANTASRSSLQVFLNGLLQMEGAARNYTVTGANQITFNSPLVAADLVVMYAFEQ